MLTTEEFHHHLESNFVFFVNGTDSGCCPHYYCVNRNLLLKIHKYIYKLYKILPFFLAKRLYPIVNSLNHWVDCVRHSNFDYNMHHHGIECSEYLIPRPSPPLSFKALKR
jgi:hypothetical protein